MRVTEKLNRHGNVLTVDIVVEDPDTLLRPWVLPEQRVTLNSDTKAVLTELNACVENDADHIVGTQ